MDILRPVKQVAGLVEQVMVGQGSVENAATAAADNERQRQLQDALHQADPSLFPALPGLRRKP